MFDNSRNVELTVGKKEKVGWPAAEQDMDNLIREAVRSCQVKGAILRRREGVDT